MYKLTLTQEERKAFDWVGLRYPTGQEWKELIEDCPMENEVDILQWEERENLGSPYWINIWDSYPNPITFLVPQHVAWELNDLATGQNGLDYPTFPCFSEELVEKLNLFLERIV